MAEESGSGATPWLALLIGALLVGVVGLGFFMFTGGHIGGGQQPSSVNVNIHAPKLPAPAKTP